MDSERMLLWIAFNVFVLSMLALDLGVFHRKAHAVSIKEASVWSLVWVSLAMVFNLGIYFVWGPEIALEFLTGYVIEKSLSVDNLFVFLMVFQYFNTPLQYQHRVLFWGILGALVLRAIFIAAGAALLNNFHWMIYVFGGFLVFTGIKMFLQGDEKLEPDKNPVVRLFERCVPIIKEYDGQKFFVRRDGKTYATLLMLVLIVVETTDVIFAVDSIPGDLRRHQRPVHRLHVERLRHPRPARALFHARRSHGNVRLSQGRLVVCARFRRRQNAARRYLQDSHRHVLVGDRRGIADLDPRLMDCQKEGSG